MGQLLFKKVFWDAIRGGTKRTTVRRWATPRVKAGQRAWSPGVGWLMVESIERVERLDQLSDTDAAADGFSSAAEMRAALRAIYPHAARDGDGDGDEDGHRPGDDRAWFRVAFRTEAPEATSGAERRKAVKRTATARVPTTGKTTAKTKTSATWKSTSSSSAATSRATSGSSRASSLAPSRPNRSSHPSSRKSSSRATRDRTSPA